MQQPERTLSALVRSSCAVAGLACVALGLVVAMPVAARTSQQLDQLDLTIRPSDVSVPVPPPEASLPADSSVGADIGVVPPSQVDEIDKVAPNRIPNRQIAPATRIGELTGQEGGTLLEEFLEKKTIPLFRVNSQF